MRFLKQSLIILLLSSSAGQTQDAPDTCGADPRTNLIGKPGIVLEELSSQRGAVRLIAPGAAITEDYSETRLNADLDAQGRITRLWCG